MKSLYGISHRESGKLHLYLLPGQVLADGSKVNVSYRVQCDREFRDSYPEFSIFSFDKKDISLDARGTHYVGKKSSMSQVGNLNDTSREFKFTDEGESYEFGVKKKGSDIAILHGVDMYYINSFSRPQIMEEGTKLFGKTRLELAKEIMDTVPSITSFDRDAVISNLDPKVKEDKESSTPKPEKEVKKESWIETVIKTEAGQAPTAKKDGFYISQANWKLLIRNIKRQVNTLIVGPTGTGKTSCIKYAAEKLGLKLTIIDMGATIDPISSLLGVHRLKDGHSVFDYAQFTQAIQEPGIILLDEVNRAPMGSGNVLFPCLDDRRVLPIEIANGDGPREIKIHPEVSFIATANLGAEYTGTSGVMDRAFLNRFFPLELTYLPEKIEKEVLKQRTGIEENESDLIVKVANTIRNMNKKMELSMAVSVRETLMISTLVSDGWSLGEAMKTVYLPMFEGTNSEGERSKLYKVLASY